MLEWETGDDAWEDVNWKLLDVAEKSNGGDGTPPPPGWRRRIAIALGVMVAMVVVGAVALEWRISQNLAAARSDIQRVIDLEMWALQNGDRDLYRSLLDKGMPAAWYRAQHEYFDAREERAVPSAEITDATLLDSNLALIEVEVGRSGSEPQRETRAYRRESDAWRRTMAPLHEPWLHPVTRETESLRFVFHRSDAERLAPLLPSLQGLYTQLLKDFNLSPVPDKREVQIVLTVKPAGISTSAAGPRYDLSSLKNTSDAEEIRRELGAQLTSKVMHQFYRDAGDMDFVLDAIHDWEMSKWMGDADDESRSELSRALEGKPYVPLMLVHAARTEAIPIQALTKTLIDYLVQREGRVVIKELVRGAGEHEGWPALIEEQLELSYSDIADGWWRSVKGRYGPAAEETSSHVRANLEWMLQLEKHAIENQDSRLFQTILDPQTSSRWQDGQVHRFESDFSGEPGERMASSSADRARIEGWTYEVQDWGHSGDIVWAVLEHTMDFQGGTFTRSNQLRTYRSADSRWYLTAPSDALTTSTLNTEHFDFRYREPDRVILEEIAPSLDTFYEQVARDLGLEASAAGPLSVEVAYSFDLPPSAGDGPNRILIHSPLMVGDLETFQLNLAASIVRKLLTHRMAGAGRLSDPLLNGLVAWEAMQWSRNAPWDDRKTETIQQALGRGVKPPLPGDTTTFDPRGIELQYYVNVTMVEYIAKTYGRGSFSEIVETAREYDEMQDLIPAALGVDVKAFEAGWRSYLQQEYSPTS